MADLLDITNHRNVGGGYIEYPYKPVKDYPAPKMIQGDAGITPPRWEEAWHGTSMNCLYSIMYHGYISESVDNTKQEKSGVYCHGKDDSVGKKDTRGKAAHYSTWSQMFANHTWYSPVIILEVNRGSPRSRSAGDQWVLPFDGCRIKAVRVAAKRSEDLEYNSYFMDPWDGLEEVHPKYHSLAIGIPPEAKRPELGSPKATPKAMPTAG